MTSGKTSQRHSLKTGPCTMRSYSAAAVGREGGSGAGKTGLKWANAKSQVNAWCIQGMGPVWQTHSVCGRSGVPGIEPGRVSWGQMWKPSRPRSCQFVLDRRVIQENGSPEIILVVFSSSCLFYSNRDVCSNTENRRHLNIRHHHQDCPWLWCLCPTQPPERLHSQGTECQLYQCKCATPHLWGPACHATAGTVYKSLTLHHSIFLMFDIYCLI